ncbi:MAG: hypothetical protein CVT49_12175 [candidate division Zixibacteria bacterium HGW-Zixibacteria-1]|nr:MAG: hypothetical protein CVT49_12175 [candidate division Zixibacteria bacterium HGW-Zixibacteria-1]
MIDDNTRFVSLGVPAADFESDEFSYNRPEEDKSAMAVGHACPDCGVGLVRLGACFSCPSCGYGGCG